MWTYKAESHSKLEVMV